MNQEKLIALGKKLLVYADRTVFAVLLMILLALIGLYLQEQREETTPYTEPPDVPFKEELVGNPSYEKVQKNYVSTNTDISKDPRINQLVEYNMFDLKSVKAAEELERQFVEQIRQAERLAGEGKNGEAMKIVESILSKKPSYVKALDLKRRLNPSNTPTPTPAK